MQLKSEKRTLTLKEWICFTLIFGFIVFLVIIELATSPHSLSPKNSRIAPKKKIEITLIGAIKEPGTYLFEPGVTLGQVLKKKKLLLNADRKKLCLKKILLCSQTIEIPMKNQ